MARLKSPANKAIQRPPANKGEPVRRVTCWRCDTGGGTLRAVKGRNGTIYEHAGGQCPRPIAGGKLGRRP